MNLTLFMSHRNPLKQVLLSQTCLFAEKQRLPRPCVAGVHIGPRLEGQCATPGTHQATGTALVNQRPSLAPHGHTGSLGRTEGGASGAPQVKPCSISPDCSQAAALLTDPTSVFRTDLWTRRYIPTLLPGVTYRNQLLRFFPQGRVGLGKAHSVKT